MVDRDGCALGLKPRLRHRFGLDIRSTPNEKPAFRRAFLGRDFNKRLLSGAAPGARVGDDSDSFNARTAGDVHGSNNLAVE